MAKRRINYHECIGIEYVPFPWYMTKKMFLYRVIKNSKIIKHGEPDVHQDQFMRTLISIDWTIMHETGMYKNTSTMCPGGRHKGFAFSRRGIPYPEREYDLVRGRDGVAQQYIEYVFTEYDPGFYLL